MTKGEALVLMVQGKKVRNRNQCLPYYMHMDNNWNVWDSWGCSVNMNAESTHGWREVIDQLIPVSLDPQNHLPEEK
jgi:hypothetical protein